MSFYFIEAKNDDTIIEYVRRPMAGIELHVDEDSVTQAVALVIQRLDTYTLVPGLAPHVHEHPTGKDGDPMPRGWMQFFGNFEEISGVFSIITRDADVIAKLHAAIKANHKTSEYIRVRTAHKIEMARKAEARR